MTLRAEEKEAAQTGVDEIHAGLQVVGASDQREVVAQLILAYERRLWDVGVLAGLHGREDEVRLVGNAEDLILEILEVKAELVQLGSAQGRGQIEDEAVQLV